MLTRGNIKLGERIFGWSIPADKTCPGASDICKQLCYAKRGAYHMWSTKNALQRNFELAKTARLVPTIIEQIRRNFISVVRIHVAGDFFSPAYIRRWQKIVKRCRQTRFYAYTRSWRKTKMLPLLADLAREKNFEMWFSWDKDMPFPPRRKRVRTCYLSTDDMDMPNRKTDLIFRDLAVTVLKYDDHHNLVCPSENGITDITCSQCKLCWRGDPRNGGLITLNTTGASAI